MRFHPTKLPFPPHAGEGFAQLTEAGLREVFLKLCPDPEFMMRASVPEELAELKNELVAELFRAPAASAAPVVLAATAHTASPSGLSVAEVSGMRPFSSGSSPARPCRRC